MRALKLGCAVFLYTFLAVTADAADSHDAAGLVGTWRLVSLEDVENGRTIRTFGEKPLGLFIFTADGHVAIQVANPANPACVVFSEKVSRARKVDSPAPRCSPKQMQVVLDGYVAYWGTYTVDTAAGVVIYHIESDLSGRFAGTEQRRPFRLEGNRLVIGDGKTWIRVLEKLH
jgi:Lipocalin-like domain